jgi:hypothetical protein
VLYPGCQHEQISHIERVFLAEGFEDDLALEHVDAYRTVGVMWGEVTAWRKGKNGKTKRAFLDERSRTAPVPHHETLVDRLLVSW